MDPANISPLVVYLVSSASSQVSGRSFEVEGGMIALNGGWRRGAQIDADKRWDPNDLDTVIKKLINEQPPAEPVYGT